MGTRTVFTNILKGAEIGVSTIQPELIGYASSPLANRSKESNTLWSTESLRTANSQRQR